MSRRFIEGRFVAGLLCLLLVAVVPPARSEPLPLGKGQFDYRAADGQTIPVLTYRAEGFSPEGPVLIVLHGSSRKAGANRSAWVEIADRMDLLVVVPHFSKQAYPASEAYQEAGTFTDAGELKPQELWTAQLVEDLFDHVVQENDLGAKTYFLHGHSAGGQFIHRMMLLMPNARVELALPANPGWYTLPTLEEKYPEGLGATPVDEAGLRASLTRKVVLLLGDRDNDPKSKQLPGRRAARAQGPHRFARGRHFFEALQSKADELGVELGWSVRVAPGVGHSNRQIAPHAAIEIEEHLHAGTE